MHLTPSWLYDLFAFSMIVVAGYGAALLLVSVLARRPRGVDVESSHVLQGIAMAGMFVPRLAFGPDLFWELTFGAFFVCFVARGIYSIQRNGLHLPHTFVHAAMSLGMLLMYWFPMGSSLGRSADMAMTASGSGGRVDPALPFLLALALFASAIFTLASPCKGAAVYGTHVSDETVASDGGAPAYLAATPSAAGGLEGLVATPQLVDLAHVVMCIAMGFMLVLML